LFPRIDIRIITGISSDLIQKLRSGLVDVVILNLNDTNYGSDIEVTRCKKINDCFVVNNSYAELLNKKVSLKELNDYPLIFQAKGSNTRTFLDDFLKKYDIILKPNIELTSYSLVVEFAKIGLGIGYVTKEYIQNEIKSNELKVLNLEEKMPSRYIGIATCKNHLPNFSTKKLIDIISDKL